MINILKKINFAVNKKVIIYSCAILMTVILFTSMLIWAALGVSVETTKIVDAAIMARDGVRSEYLVGEKINSDGFALSVDNQIITDCKVELDTTTAGIKSARVFFERDNTIYQGHYPITVFSIRHLDIQKYPTSITVGEDGKAVLNEAVIWAELSGEPKELPLQDEHPDWKTTIALSASNYTVELGESPIPGGNLATVRCGNSSVTFVQVSIAGKEIILNSPSRILSFENKNASGETLKLLVTKSESNNSDGEVGAEGIYVYADASGQITLLNFAYYMNGWASNFVSSKFEEGVTEKQVGDDYEMIYNGITFLAHKDSWHAAIITL